MIYLPNILILPISTPFTDKTSYLRKVGHGNYSWNTGNVLTSFIDSRNHINYIYLVALEQRRSSRALAAWSRFNGTRLDERFYLVTKLALTRNLVKARLVQAGHPRLEFLSAVRGPWNLPTLCFIFVSPFSHIFPFGYSVLTLYFSPLPLPRQFSTLPSEDSEERSSYAGETSSFCEAESPKEEAIEISKRSRPRGAIL